VPEQQIAQLVARGRDARRDSRLQEALACFTQALDLSRRDDATPSLAALEGLGQIRRDGGDTEAALAAYAEAAALRRLQDDKRALAHTIRQLGDIHRESGDGAAAEPLLTEALELYRGIPDTGALELANAVRSLASLRGDQDARPSAMELWEEARALYAQAGVDAGVLECRSKLVELQRRP
jgi:tetratricopeptide (TPR) repeat protein